jgi:antitoxin ChpS
MTTATLRNVGGSVMVAIPPPILRLVHLSSGSRVVIEVKEGELVIRPVNGSRYSLSDLLAQCDKSDFELTEEDRAWLDDAPVGREEL